MTSCKAPLPLDRANAPEQTKPTYGLSNLKPMSIFLDMTYLGDDVALVHAIRRHCIDREYIPLIDHDPELGWVFHTMFCPDTTVSKKKIAARFEPASYNERTEHHIESALAHRLQAQGYTVQRQVRCGVGIADVVTEEAVYELKVSLSLRECWSAIGQVLVYRQVLGTHLRAVIVGRRNRDADPLYDYARELGIEFIFWED